MYIYIYIYICLSLRPLASSHESYLCASSHSHFVLYFRAPYNPALFTLYHTYFSFSLHAVLLTIHVSFPPLILTSTLEAMLHPCVVYARAFTLRHCILYVPLCVPLLCVDLLSRIMCTPISPHMLHVRTHAIYNAHYRC